MEVFGQLNLDGHRESISAQSTIPSSNPVSPDETSTAETGLFPVGTGSVLLILIVGLSWLLLIKRLITWKPDPVQSVRFKSLASASCSKCKFFNRNPYLKCAVHPSTVLRTEAKDCPDYWEKDEDQSTH